MQCLNSLIEALFCLAKDIKERRFWEATQLFLLIVCSIPCGSLEVFSLNSTNFGFQFSFLLIYRCPSVLTCPRDDVQEAHNQNRPKATVIRDLENAS